MDDKDKEWNCTISIPDEATNIEVGKQLEKLFNFLLNNKAKAIACKMLPNEKEIYVKPFIQLKIKRPESWFEVHTELKKENQERWDEHFSFMFAETIIDIWNKFMPIEFVFMIDEQNPYKIMIGWDCGMNKEQIKEYWFSNSSDGYNPDAQFWRREWLKDEHKRNTRSGGKV